MRVLMGLRTTILVLTILISGCATTAFEPTPDPAVPIPHNSVLNERTNLSEQHTQHQYADEHESLPVRHTNLWDRIRAGFAFPSIDNQYVDDYEKWYAERPKYIARVVERARPYLYYIVEEVENRGMPTELVLLPAIESAFVPTAYSRARAVGLWQFIPGTARRYDLKINWWYDGRRDVVESTRAALDYLEFLHKEFDGDWFLALAAYNAGEGKIAHEIKRNKSKGRDTNYSNLRLKSETRRYVPKLVAFKEIINDPAHFGITLSSIPNKPYFTSVDTGGQIDLNIAREISGVDAKEIRHLNAAFKRWSTDPDGPHRLLVPVSNAAVLQQALATLPDSARVKWGSYTIRQGDTLGKIAQNYGVSVSALQQSNHLKGTFIRAGKTLLIPLSEGSTSRPIMLAFADTKSQQDPLVHRVRSGDTLWGIARRYDVHVDQLTKWNSIRTRDTLRLGQTIVVYMN
jgi:membrane-bound lytic murein transglycosylase D